MVFLFVDVVAIRHKFQDAFARIHLAPDWIFTICSVVGTIASGVGIAAIFTSPWTKKLSTELWDAWMIGITIVALIVAVVVFFMGQRAIRSDMSDEELIAEVTR